MKIKIGTMWEKEITRCDDDIQPVYDGTTTERVTVQLLETSKSARAISDEIQAAMDGAFVILGSGEEERFSGFRLENVRKTFSERGKEIAVSFVSAKEQADETVAS